jgi:hypothetical protein
MLLFVFLISCLFLMPLKLEKNSIHEQPFFSFRCRCTIVFLSFLLACLPCLPNSPPPSFPPAHLWPFSFVQALFLLATGICSSLLLACQETPRNEVVAVARE